MTVEPWFYFATIVLAWGATGFAWATAWRWRRIEKRSAAMVDEMLAVVESMERSQDPGRTVHERLAAALEPTLVRGPEAGDRPAPEVRRSAAMIVAGQMIETIERANLQLTTKDEPT